MTKPLNNKSALVYAVDLLAARPYSVKQLTGKLKRRGYGGEEIESALSRLMDRHYLDDADLCQRQLLSYLSERKRSVKAIRYKLIEKGFSSEDIENAFCSAECDMEEYERGVSLRLLTGRFKASDSSAENRQKVFSYLYRKGFDSSVVRAAADSFFAGTFDD